MLEGLPVDSIELSALRYPELRPLLEALGELDLSRYTYISLHAPSRYEPEQEREIADLLHAHAPRHWPIILHPDAVRDFGPWRDFREQLSIENMDRRKPVGRSLAELRRIFDEVPQATFCFDIGHARQFDTTMTEAYLLLREFQGRLRQVHVSEVNTASQHEALSFGAIRAFQQVAGLIPESIPLILESRVVEQELLAELGKAQEALALTEQAPALH